MVLGHTLLLVDSGGNRNSNTRRRGLHFLARWSSHHPIALLQGRWAKTDAMVSWVPSTRNCAHSSSSHWESIKEEERHGLWGQVRQPSRRRCSAQRLTMGVCSQGRTRWKERLDARKLSSDLHMHSKARSCPHIYTSACVLTHAQT